MPNSRVSTLDGLRGLLALAVLVYHCGQRVGSSWLPSAWVSVDIFFVMSGFVLVRAYDGRIASGMRFRSFALARLRRLYPVYLVGALLGAVVFLLRDTAEHGRTLLILSALALMLMPYFGDAAAASTVHAADRPVYPLNDPAWSLFLELFVNLVFFAQRRLVPRLSSAVIVAGALPIYCWTTQHYSLHAGWSQDNFAGGFIRVVFFFYIGAIIHDIQDYLPRLRPACFYAALATLLVLFNLRRPESMWTALLLIGPLTVVCASRIDDTALPAPLRRLMEALGHISYPLYIIHFPVMILFLQLGMAQYGPVVYTVVCSTVSIGIACLVAVPPAISKPPVAAAASQEIVRG